MLLAQSSDFNFNNTSEAWSERWGGEDKLKEWGEVRQEAEQQMNIKQQQHWLGGWRCGVALWKWHWVPLAARAMAIHWNLLHLGHN